MQSEIMTRRGLLIGATSATILPDVAPAQDMSEELQSGDPGAEQELIVADQEAIGDLFRIVAFNIKKNAKEVALRTLKVASEFIGKNQDDNPEMVEEFFAIFGMAARNKNGRFLPFCAAGLSFCAARAYCDYEDPKPFSYTSTNRIQILKEALSDVNKFYFRPNPLVRIIEADARKRNTWLEPKVEKNLVHPGYLIVYNWNRDGRANHIGLVEERLDDAVRTIEFNTRLTRAGDQSRGGFVLKKTRGIGDDVLGFVRTYT